MFGNFFLLHLNAQYIKNKQIETYVDYLTTQNTSAKDYILNLFEKYDIVFLCERDHAEHTQYDFIYDIVSDTRFIEQAGSVFMEVGVSNSYNLLDFFLHNPNFSDKEIEEFLLKIIRNNDFYPLWEKKNYPDFIKKLYYLNKSLAKRDQIDVYPSDIPFSWNSVSNRKQYKQFMRDTIDTEIRDSIIGVQIRNKITEIRENTEKRKKFLIILNAYHSWFKPTCAAWWIKQAYPMQTSNVLIHSRCYNSEDYLIDDGKWDAAFSVINKSNIGFDFNGTPFGNTPFKKYSLHAETTEKMQDYFNGFVFYEPIEKHLLSWGYPNFVDENFEKEMKRRNQIYYGKWITFFIGSTKKYYNTVKEKSYNNLDKLIQQRDKWK
jgi:hypothetical protein